MFEVPAIVSLLKEIKGERKEGRAPPQKEKGDALMRLGLGIVTHPLARRLTIQVSQLVHGEADARYEFKRCCTESDRCGVEFSETMWSCKAAGASSTNVSNSIISFQLSS